MKADRPSPVQAMTITVAAIFGVDFLIVQNTMVSIAQQDAWISLLLGGIVTVLSAMNMYYLATLYPDKDLPQIIIHVGGKFLGRILLLFISLYILLYAGLSVRIFA